MKKIINILMVILLAVTLTGCGEDKKYNKAVELMHQNNYEAAIEKFEKIKDYKDSANLIDECHKNIVSNLLSNNEITAVCNYIKGLSQHEKFVVESIIDDDFKYFFNNYYGYSSTYDSVLKEYVDMYNAVSDGSSDKATFMEYLISISPELDKYTNIYYVLASCNSSFITQAQNLEKYIESGNLDAIKGDVIPNLSSIASQIEASEYYGDEKVKTYCEGIKNFGLCLEQEVNATTAAESEAAYNKRLEALNQINSVINDYNNNYIPTVNMISTYYSMYFSL